MSMCGDSAKRSNRIRKILATLRRCAVLATASTRRNSWSRKFYATSPVTLECDPDYKTPLDFGLQLAQQSNTESDRTNHAGRGGVCHFIIFGHFRRNRYFLLQRLQYLCWRSHFY